MKRRTFLKGTAAAGAMAAAGPFVHIKANAYTSVPEPGPDELRIIESAKTGKLIDMKHQVPVAPNYGDAKTFAPSPV